MFHKYCAGHWQLSQPFGRIPSATYERIFGYVLDKVFEVFMTVQIFIQHGLRQFSRRFTLEYHFHISWWQVPVRITRRHVQTRRILWLVTVGAFHGVKSFTVHTTLYVHGMYVAVVAL